MITTPQVSLLSWYLLYSTWVFNKLNSTPDPPFQSRRIGLADGFIEPLSQVFSSRLEPLFGIVSAINNCKPLPNWTACAAGSSRTTVPLPHFSGVATFLLSEPTYQINADIGCGMPADLAPLQRNCRRFF